jgi:hypothetical protein
MGFVCFDGKIHIDEDSYDDGAMQPADGKRL